MFPYSSNAYNPFAYINNHHHHHHHSTNIRPESNFSMDTTTSIDHGNFQTTTQIDEDDDHDHHHHHDDGLLLSQLLSQQQLLLAQSDSDHHQVEELEDHHELEVDTNNTKAGGFLMMKKKKTTTTTTVVPRRRTGKKDRHSKICTAQGPRDRRMRLSLQIARKFFDLQDMLGFDKASKTIEWLFLKSKSAIKELKENVSRPPQPPPPPPPPSQGKPNCQIMSSCGNYNSEISRVRILESDHEKKKRNFFSKVGRESREKARERARERTREKMKMKMKIRSKQQSCSYDQDQEMKMEAVCAADHDQATIMDEELVAGGAGGDDDELHYNCCGQQQGIMMMRGLSRSRWSMISDYLQQDQDHEIGVTSSTGANSEEDFLDNFHGNWDTTSSSASHVNNSKTQSFNCTISNNAKRFTAEAPAAGNPLCYPIFSTTNFSDIQAAEEEEEEEEKPITSNYYSINLFPNTCCSDIAPPGQNPSSIFMNQLSDQQQNPTTFNNTCPPTFLTSLIAQDHQNPTSNSSFTTSNIFWQSQFLENQYFSSNPII